MIKLKDILNEDMWSMQYDISKKEIEKILDEHPGLWEEMDKLAGRMDDVDDVYEKLKKKNPKVFKELDKHFSGEMWAGFITYFL